MKIPYYPGCTMKADKGNGTGFEQSAVAAAAALDIELVEMPRWYCCGTVYSTASDDLMKHLGSVRNLSKVQQAGEQKVVTLCSMCYNTLAMVNVLLKQEPDKLTTINDFMAPEEEPYQGEVNVLHFLQVLQTDIGFEKITSQIKTPLNGLKIAPYYGCVLTRPKDVAIDDMEEPRIMHELLHVLGAEVIDDPYKVECCGSYQTIGPMKEAVVERTYRIVQSMVMSGAEAIVLTCPLCEFNLDAHQKEALEKHPDLPSVPIFYFSQLLVLALGLDPRLCRFENHHIDPRPLLTKLNIIKEIPQIR
ncbi:MAG: CoB--CoM heterodisulfide reductase iron-sulfur subunit B family protein [Candidatus Hermodarchaeia archaeon]|jgi:heterodisulfide reductase subunit B